jgi:hypothetical protein
MNLALRRFYYSGRNLIIASCRDITARSKGEESSGPQSALRVASSML